MKSTTLTLSANGAELVINFAENEFTINSTLYNAHNESLRYSDYWTDDDALESSAWGNAADSPDDYTEMLLSNICVMFTNYPQTVEQFNSHFN